MKNIVRFLCTIIFLQYSTSAFASHIVGVDLYYSYVSANTYRVNLAVYGDCAGGAFGYLPGGTPLICVYNGDTSVSNVVLTLMPPTNGIEITPVCPADVNNTQCTNISNAIPGIKKFVYSGYCTLPYPSKTWRFIFTGEMGGGTGMAGRSPSITNIISGTAIQLVDTLDNTTYNNTSAALTVPPTPFFCINNRDTYNPGAIDSDRDSLSFSLVAGMDGSGNCGSSGVPVTYLSSYSATAPLATSSFMFDPKTGQMIFDPNALQRSLVVYNIEEFHKGTLVGTCQREMTFLVQACTVPPALSKYSTATAGTIIDNTHYQICGNNGLFSITIPTTEVSDNNIYVSATNLPAGLSFNAVGNGIGQPVSTLSGDAHKILPGTYIFYVTAQDDACPLNGISTEAFSITVLQPPVITAYPAAEICKGTSMPMHSSGGVKYTWKPDNGLSCNSCSDPIAAPSSTTIYTVMGTASNGCANSDTVILKVLSFADFNYDIKYGCKNDTVIFSNNSTNATGYLWDFGDGSHDTVANPVHYYPPVSTNTNVTVTLHDINPNCPNDLDEKTFTLTPAQHFSLINVTSSQIIPYTTSIKLNAEGADTYSWSPNDGTLSDIYINDPIASPLHDITYIVTGQLGVCTDTVSVHIIVEFEDDAFLPTAFTPNADGKNDIARIINLKYNKLISFRIFNRWGQEIFHTTDANDGWNGTFNGEKQDIGTYMYEFSTVHPDGKGLHLYKGNITLIR